MHGATRSKEQASKLAMNIYLAQASLQLFASRLGYSRALFSGLPTDKGKTDSQTNGQTGMQLALSW